MQEAAKDFRILMLDQRGTGLSTPLTRQTLHGMSAQEQADRLRHFRAESIVRDAEAFREHLGAETWSVLGQSFGGFCTLTYLSLFPASLERALLTGGLAPLTGHAERVYEHTYAKMAARNADTSPVSRRTASGWTPSWPICGNGTRPAIRSGFPTAAR